MSRKGRQDNDLTALDELIEDITVDAYGDDEQLWAFRQAFEDEVSLPADGFVIGEPVAVVEIDYDGNERRGLTAKCRRADGSEHVVGATDRGVPGKVERRSLCRCLPKMARFRPSPSAGSRFTP